MLQKWGHAIMGSCCLNNKNLADRLRFLQNAMGPVPSPFDCFLVNRSLKTLKLRMEEHQKNGLIVAKFLEAHPFVEKVQHLLLGTIHILRNHIFRIFGPPSPLRKHVFSTENNQKLAFSDPPPPLQVIT